MLPVGKVFLQHDVDRTVLRARKPGEHSYAEEIVTREKTFDRVPDSDESSTKQVWRIEIRITRVLSHSFFSSARKVLARRVAAAIDEDVASEPHWTTRKPWNQKVSLPGPSQRERCSFIQLITYQIGSRKFSTSSYFQVPRSKT